MEKNSNKVAGPNGGMLNRSGRPKGTPNKATKALKDMILAALEGAGGQEYLEEQAHANPAAFLTLIGKVLPSEINAQLTGKDGAALLPTINVRFVKPGE